ncbi:MAG: response regulator receiver modulated diguanylate phosphodiesterase [Actinomycetia bacterium]|nr:response regulator receiver modulated diguanylate phosphodiesterase [Actinomycetes bacterium]
MNPLYTPSPPTTRPLAHLLGGRTLEIAFQPVVDLRHGTLSGVESLLRIERDGHWALPGETFDRAAASGLTLGLELAALTLALARVEDVPNGGFLALNASPSTILSDGFSALLDEIDLHRIVVEITENEAIGDYQPILEVLDGLRRRGLRVAIDDTGAGASTFRHIIRLRPDIVKLDVTLVDEICTDPIQRALVRAMVHFADDIGSVLIAEGIEDATQAPALRDLGVPFGQGFALGRPGPLARRA